MDLLTTEGPALLGYAAFAALIGSATFATYLTSSPVAATRRRNRAVRHARKGCAVCRLRLEVEAAGR